MTSFAFVEAPKHSRESSKSHHHTTHPPVHGKHDVSLASPAKPEPKEPTYKPPEVQKRTVVEPAKEKTPEPELEHNLEEEMTAAETLQQIMDNEPLHEAEPIIHIPDEEGDMMTDDERRREAELAASIASIENIPEPTVTERPHFAHQSGPPNFGKNVEEKPEGPSQQSVPLQHPQHIR